MTTLLHQSNQTCYDVRQFIAGGNGMTTTKGWKLWDVVDEFKKDHRKMLRIACPDCGFESEIRKTRLHDDRQCKRCACISRNKQTRGRHRGVGDLTLSFYNYFRFNAKRRGLEFTVSVKELWDLAVAQGHKCALSGLPIEFPTMTDVNGNWVADKNAQQRVRTGAGRVQMASLDRIDSSKGYISGNVQWVNKWVNLMKNGLSQDEFIHLCHMVASLHGNPELSRLNWFPYGQSGIVGRKVQRLEGEDTMPITPPRVPNTPPVQAEGEDIVRYSGEIRRGEA